MLQDVSLAPLPVAVRRRRRLPRYVRRIITTAVVVLISWGVDTYREHQRPPALPEFAGALPRPTSYWTFYGGLGTTDSGILEPTRLIAQRAPGSEAIVVELEAGFGSLDGETLLATPEGAWFFDRQSGALEPTPIVDDLLHRAIDLATTLKSFADLAPEAIERYAVVSSIDELPTDRPGAAGSLTSYEIEVDVRTFAAESTAAFDVWMQQLGVAYPGQPLPDLGVPDDEPVTVEIVADEAGTVWSWRLMVDATVILEYELTELSDGPFIPPDPTPDPILAPAPDVTLTPDAGGTPPPVVLPVQTTP